MIEVLGRQKPIVGMVHLAPLPGSPFDQGLSREAILDRARRDLDVLLSAGFDAVSFSNESDRPFVNVIPREQIALFTHLVSRLTENLTIPFGCGMLIDPLASLAVAHAVGARFVRVSYGVTAGIFGFEVHAPGDILRYRRQIGATDVQTFVNVVPHMGTSLDARSMADIIQSAAVWTGPDAIQVGGPSAGAAPDLEFVSTLRARVPGVPIIISSGITNESLAMALEVGDGIIVGTSLKVDGSIWNPIDPQRASSFMQRVRDVRGN
jgi:membrane complex biogenesis BtpA family protein